MPCFKQYDSKRNHIGFLCGKLGKHCHECADIADYLCDYPVGNGKTCDRLLCEHHAIEIGPNLHYCPTHHEEWSKFRDSGGVIQELQNILPYKRATSNQ